MQRIILRQLLIRILLISGLGFWIGSVSVSAQSLTLSRLQQQINITNGEFSTISGTDSPTDNSLGLISFDSSNYSSPVVYFEVVARCLDCTGGNDQMSVSLYNSSGVVQTTLTTDSNTYVRLRSGNIILPAGQYTVRFHRDAEEGSANLKAARLIINQATNNLTLTQSQIEVGHYENRTNLSASTLLSPKYYLYNDAAFSGDVTAYFEATLNTANNLIASTYYFDDYDSGSLEWTTNPANMTNGATATFASTTTDNQTQRLISNSASSSDNGLITKVELRVHGYQTDGTDGQVVLRPRFSGNTNGSNYNYALPENVGNAAWSDYFDITDDGSAPSSWSWQDIDDLDVDVIFDKGADGNNTAYVSVVQVRVTHADTSKIAYAQLYNLTTSSVVATVSTSNHTPTLLRSSELITNWNTTTPNEYVVRVYTSDAANPVYLANAKVVLEQSEVGGIRETEMVHHYITTNRQQTNSIYTQETFINLFEPNRFANTNVIRTFFETTSSTAVSGSTFAGLYDRTNTDFVDDPTDSELLVFNSETFTRSRSPNLYRNLDWPTADAELTTVIKASDGDTATVVNSVLIIQAVAMDPELSFTISGVAQGETNNGVTTTGTSTVTTLPFGHLGIADPQFVSHQLEVSTNEAASGYVVYVSLASPMQGYYPANFIDPFAGSGALWTSPQLWSTPDGTSPNDDSGWLGANTSDTRVTGWSSGFAKFGPISTTPVEVMRSSVGNTQDSHFVSYGLEVNVLQPADTYSALLIYDILPTY